MPTLYYFSISTVRILLILLFVFSAQVSLAQIGTVYNSQKIADNTGGFTGAIDLNDQFGSGLEEVGDFDGDGVVDLLFGSPFDDDGGHDRGAAYLLFMDPNGTVKSHQKISDTQGGFTGGLLDDEVFGSTTTSIGDLDQDGVTDLVVGQIRSSDGGTWNGAVWVLFMNANGTVKNHQKISNTAGGFTGTFTSQCGFGGDVTFLGDLDGDGNGDIAVGARRYEDQGSERGAVFILFLNANGTVKAHTRISHLQGGFPGSLSAGDAFGSVANIGDLDGDGVVDLAVGALGDNDGGANTGAVWIVFLNANGTAKATQKISDTQGGFLGTIDSDDLFGTWCGNIGDLDGDNVVDVMVGARGDDDGGTDRGSVWILFLNPNGTVKGHQKISDTQGGFSGGLANGDKFGQAITSADISGNGVRELIICSQLDDTGGQDKGAVWILSVAGCREFIPITPDTTFCPGDSLVLSVGNSSTYQWSPAASLSCSTCQSPVAIPTATTVYQVIVADSLGCIDTLSVTVSMDTCAVNDTCDAYAADFSWTLSGGLVTFTDITAPATTFSEWDFGDGNTTSGGGSNSPVSYQYQANGVYQVCLISGITLSTEVTCRDTICKTLNLMTVGIEDNILSGMSVFPNPVVGEEVNLIFEGEIQESLTLKLMDIFGREIRSQFISGPVKKATMPIAGISSGVYFLVIYEKNYTHAVKLLISRK